MDNFFFDGSSSVKGFLEKKGEKGLGEKLSWSLWTGLGLVLLFSFFSSFFFFFFRSLSSASLTRCGSESMAAAVLLERG